MQLGRTAQVFAIQGMFNLTLDEYRYRFIHFVADNASFDGAQLLSLLGHGKALLLGVGQQHVDARDFAANTADVMGFGELARGFLHAERELLFMQNQQMGFQISRRFLTQFFKFH
jgi:hypothetical protein